MLFVFLFFSLTFERTADSEYIIYNHQSKRNPGRESSLKFKHTENGFVSIYSGDDSNSTEFYKLYVLGYNCLTLAPHIDRVLLIPTDFYISNNKLQHLSSVWNIVLRLNNIDSKCFENEKNENSKQIWFRIVAQRLTMYNKLLFIGHEIIFVNDPDLLFDYQTPAAPLDYDSWGFTYFGVAHNFDMFLFSPNENTYNILVNMTCKWMEFPYVHPQRYNSNSFFVSIGPYDNGLFHEYFGKDVMTFPPFANVEVGPVSLMHKLKYDDPKIISFRFNLKNPPWTGSTIADIAWKVIAEEAFKYRNIHFNQLGKPKQSETITREIIKTKLKNIQFPIYKDIECNNDFVSFSGKSVLIRSIALLSIGLLFILFSIRNQPKGQSDLVYEIETNESK